MYIRALLKVACCILLFLPGSLFLPGCSGRPAGSPMIRLFTFTGQETNRRNIFYFKIEWEDAEGDLNSQTTPARVVLKIEDPDNPNQAPIEFPLQYDQRLIKAGALSGTIPDNATMSPIHLSAEIRPDPGNPYPKRLKVTATLFDSSGNSSNQPWVIIQSQSN